MVGLPAVTADWVSGDQCRVDHVCDVQPRHIATYRAAFGGRPTPDPASNTFDSVTTVRLATLDDLPQIARVQMRAFQYDPLITWMLPADGFDRRATLSFDCLIRASMIHGSIYTTDDGVCTAVWAPPEAWAFSEEQIGMMAEPFAEAAGEMVDRALGVLIEMAEVHPSEPHWYLEVLGTHPDWQRRGIACGSPGPGFGPVRHRWSSRLPRDAAGEQRSVLPSAHRIRGHRHEATLERRSEHVADVAGGR